MCFLVLSIRLSLIACTHKHNTHLPGNMRLRILVRRNGFPDTKLVWPCSPSEDLTIAKLLTEINDVVPLESVEWGLEDYAVELGDGSNTGPSFECLHFQVISQILKDEDQILIRPLLDGDLKRRKISGRHQISTDGKHLVDGVAFGRPWLRAPRDRPMLEIPPRKRARMITDIDNDDADEEDEDSEDEEHDYDYGGDNDDNEMLRLENGVASDHSSDDEYEDEDAGDDDGMNEELQLLRRDNDTEADDTTASQRASAIRGLLPTLDSVAALRKAYPLLPAKTIEQSLERNQNDIGETHRALLRSNHPIFSFDEMMDKAVTGILDDSSGSDNEEQNVAHTPVPSRPLIQEVDMEDGPQPRIQEVESDSDTSSSGSSDSEDESESDDGSDQAAGVQSSASHASETLQNVRVSVFNAMELDDESDRSEFESYVGNSVRRKVDELLSEDSGSEEDFQDDSSDESSDDSSSESSDDSSSEDSDDSDAPSVQGVRDDNRRNGMVKVVEEATNEHESAEPQPQAAPGEGLSKTQKRNARRRKAKQAKAQQIDTDTAEVLESLAARKAALLNTIDTEPDGAQDTNVEQAAQQPVGGTPAATDNASKPTLTEDSKSTETAPRRMRMDVGAGRRLLFGALGLKNPKTKADEEALRKDMMKHVRPLQNKRLVEEVQEQPQEEEDDDSWKDKITYRAVECCQEGVELSEPPFPFVQRWDPQQQYSSVRKRKRKSQQFDDSYYDPSQDMQPTDDTPVKKAKTSDQGNQRSSDEQPQVEELNYDDEAAHDVDADEDLPHLPANVSALPVLSKDNVKPGMVVTWKQLSMSKATNWQPQMIDQTAMVVQYDTDGLRVILAQRDREYDDKEYDDETGARIYNKFEAPDFEEEDDGLGEDDGYRLLGWSELSDARVVQADAPAGFAHLISTKQISEVEVSDMGAVEAMRGEEHEQDSHPIESAQQIPRLGSLSADDALNSMTTDSWTSRANAGGTATDEVVVRDAMSDDEEIIADSNPSPVVPIGHVPEFEAGVESILASTPGVESDAASASGSSVDEETVIPESNPVVAESVSEHSLRSFSPGTSPLPSIAELYQSAASQRASQRASQATSAESQATKAKLKKNAEYEDAMQRLDNGDAFDQGEEADDLFPNATQPANKPSGAEVAPRPRSTPDRKAKRKAKEAFAVPEGSQVVDLLSSPAASEGRSRKKQTAPATRRTTSYQILQNGGGRSLRRQA